MILFFIGRLIGPLIREGYREMPDSMYLDWLFMLRSGQSADEDYPRRYDNRELAPPDYDGPIGTVGGGRFKESYHIEPLMRVGSIMYDTERETVAYIMSPDTLWSEARLEPEVTSRWFSIDPKAHEFYSWSPYNYALNNPVNLVDPDGQAPVSTCSRCAQPSRVRVNARGRAEFQETRMAREVNRANMTRERTTTSYHIRSIATSNRASMADARARGNNIRNTTRVDAETGLQTTNGNSGALGSLVGGASNSADELVKASVKIKLPTGSVELEVSMVVIDNVAGNSSDSRELNAMESVYQKDKTAFIENGYQQALANSTNGGLFILDEAQYKAMGAAIYEAKRGPSPIQQAAKQIEDNPNLEVEKTVETKRERGTSIGPGY